MDRYSDFIKAIKMDSTIKSPNDMIDLITRSVEISNKQGYTNILSMAQQQDRRFDERTQYNKQQQQHYNRQDKR
jgi:hypothetical protein